MTLSCLPLALTDDDSTSHGPFDAATHVMACYVNAKHMLCMFHAVVMKFHGAVYRKLPKKKGTRALTASAALYGTDFPVSDCSRMFSKVLISSVFGIHIIAL